MESHLQLSKATQSKNARLAEAAGRSPATMLRFVLRDGLAAVELSVQENLAADAEFSSLGAVAHSDVMRQARASLRRQQPTTALAA